MDGIFGIFLDNLIGIDAVILPDRAWAVAKRAGMDIGDAIETCGKIRLLVTGNDKLNAILCVERMQTCVAQDFFGFDRRDGIKRNVLNNDSRIGRRIRFELMLKPGVLLVIKRIKRRGIKTDK